MKINRVGLIGAGAVGSMIASLLYKAHPESFAILATGTRCNRLHFDGINVNGEKLAPTICDIADGLAGFDVIILTVKNYHLESVIKELTGCLSPHTYVLSLLNGVTAPNILRTAFPENKVLNGIVMRTDAARQGHRVTFSTAGELQFGFDHNDPISDDVTSIRNWLSVPGLKPVVYPDMLRMLWKKWLINIGANQVSVVAHAEFKYFGLVPEIVTLLKRSMDEIVEIAHRKDIDIAESDRDDAIRALIHYPPHKKTSMLQDIEACRRTEIDAFAGMVVKYGLECGIPTPYNEALFLGIKAMEKVYLSK